MLWNFLLYFKAMFHLENDSRGDLPDPEIEPVSSALQADSLPLSHLGSPEMS